MRAFLRIVLLSLFCAPLVASDPLQQMALVCVEGKGDARYVTNSRGTRAIVWGTLEVDQKLFEQAQRKYEAEKAQQLIWAQEAHEENERNRIEYERRVHEAKDNYEKKWLEERREQIDGDMVYSYSRKIGSVLVASGGIVGTVLTFLAYVGQGLYFSAVGSTLFVAGAGYGIWHGFQQILDIYEMTPPPFKGLGYTPAERGYPAIGKKPESSEHRFKVFMPILSEKLSGDCDHGGILKAQSLSTGYVYPLKSRT